MRAEQIKLDFQHWLSLGQRENKEENCGNIEETTLISKLQTRCIIARAQISKLYKNYLEFDHQIRI